MAYGVLGLWAFTNLEIAYALLRVDERRRTYLIASVSNVVLTVALTVTLVVGFDGGARGYVLGNYAASTVVLVGLWVFALRHRIGLDLRAPRTLGPLLRFGAPTVPADAAVFALNVVDRAWLLRADSPAAAGLYAVSVKLATLVIVAVRGFQAAWPPLAYSIADEDEARHLYALVTTAYVIVTGLVVAGLTLLGRWVVRLLTADPFYPAHKALPWVALGWALYGLFLVFVTIAGRAKVTTRTFPAAVVGPGGQRRRPRAAGRAARPLGRGHRAVRGLPGDARRRPPAHAAAVRGALRLAAPGPHRRDRGRDLGGGRAAAADERRRRASRCARSPWRPSRSRSRPSCCACAASSSQARLNGLRESGWRGPAGGRTARGAGVVVGEGISPPDTQETSMTRPFLLAALALASALVLAACGSSGSSGTSSSSATHDRHHAPPARRARPRSSPPRRARWAPSSSTPRAARSTCGTPTTARRARAAARARRRGRR